MVEEDFNRFMRSRNQLAVAAEHIVSEDNLFPVLTPTLSKDMGEQLKLSHKVVDLVERANRNICVTLLRYIVVRPEIFYAQVRTLPRKKEDDNFQQIVFVNYNLDDFS